MSSSLRVGEIWEGGRRFSTLEVPLDLSHIRAESRDGRRYSTLEVPLESSHRRGSRDSSAPGSSEASRDGRRRYASTLELPLRSQGRSTSRTPVGAASRYRYTPLDPKNKRAIRVIRIWPDLVDGKIACEVDQVTTDSRYSALSYTWGSAKDAHETVLINGHRCMVRRNLWAFLDHAREYHARKALWIDAICINQDDIEEKNRQVQMMSRIYTRTEEVLVWLGPRVDYAGHCLRRMQAYEGMSDTEMALSSSKDSEFWKGFKAINSSRYWDRVWVVQEFIQSKKGRIIQGDRWISFDTFQNTIRRFDNRIYRLVLQYWVFGKRRNESFEVYISNIHPLWQMRLERARSHEDHAKWAQLSGSRFCRDIRDRVYGIMPLATHGDSLRVDYHLNPFELLLESIWLEHDTEMDRTVILMNLANILLLTPASVCMYAQHHTSAGRRYRKLLRVDAEKMHLEAASSYAREEDWLLASSHGHSVKWRNFAMDQRLRIPKGLLEFPGREQCPWQMFTYTATGKENIGLKLAVDSQNVPDRKGRIAVPDYRKERAMSEEDFLDRNRKKSLGLGVYETKCAPYPLRIFYSMVDGLEALGKDNKLFQALDGLDVPDLDL